MQIDQIVRSSRKTIALIVRRDGSLVVRAPLHLPDREILRFVSEKADWIRRKQSEAQQRKAQSGPKGFTEGEAFLYLGQTYPLRLVQRARPALALEDEHFVLARTALPQGKEVFQAWYRQQARQVFAERLAQYAAANQLSFKQLRISSARTRWGSCSTTGTISLTWRLVMAPLPVIDYVVVHELAHLMVKDHSRRFWNKVRAIMPDYQRRQDWLKQHGSRLTIE